MLHTPLLLGAIAIGLVDHIVVGLLGYIVFGLLRSTYKYINIRWVVGSRNSRCGGGLNVRWLFFQE